MGVKQPFNVVIDGLNSESAIKALPIYMNDCRRNIMRSHRTAEDERVMNVRLIETKHNGWPKYFAVTTRNVPKGQELFTCYGKTYVHTMVDYQRTKANQEAARKTVR